MATSKARKSSFQQNSWPNVGLIICVCDPTGSHKTGPFSYVTLEKANVTERESIMFFPMSERRRRRTMAITEPPMDFYWFAKVQTGKYNN